jgi:putative SOS response-associated peptidase YedK
MCNLYSYKLSRDEIRGLIVHYKLIGTEWAEQLESEMRGKNEPSLVYPNYMAPVAIVREGNRSIEQLRWGMPGPAMPPKPGGRTRHPARVTNVRNTSSGHWKPWLASAEVVVGAERNRGGRCLVPAAMFAEPDRNTAKPVVNRWFRRADGLPFFFAGVWSEWQGDRGTKKEPSLGLHRVFAILTTEPNGVVQPIHSKAMPVMLMNAADVERWLTGTMEEALKLQKPQPNDALLITPFDEKKAA